MDLMSGDPDSRQCSVHENGQCVVVIYRLDPTNYHLEELENGGQKGVGIFERVAGPMLTEGRPIQP